MTEVTHKSLKELRDAIAEQVKCLSDGEPYSDTIISLNLKMANDKFGEAVKNKFIDEFGLEKFGWRKDSEEINDGIIIDYGENDNIIGIEILNYTDRNLNLNELIKMDADEIIPVVVQWQ